VSRDNFGIVSNIHNKALDPQSVSLQLAINGEEQEAMLFNAIWKVPHILEHLTKYMTIKKGDVLLTGSPFFNERPLKVGDHITGRVMYDHRAVINAETVMVARN